MPAVKLPEAGTPTLAVSTSVERGKWVSRNSRVFGFGEMLIRLGSSSAKGFQGRFVLLKLSCRNSTALNSVVLRFVARSFQAAVVVRRAGPCSSQHNVLMLHCRMPPTKLLRVAQA